MELKVNIDAREAIKQLRFYQLKKKDQIRGIITSGAFDIDRDAKKGAPVITTRLRSSIHPEFQRNGLGALVGTDVEYAAFVEFGTSKQEAQPYLRPAFEKHNPRIVKDIIKILRES